MLPRVAWHAIRYGGAVVCAVLYCTVLCCAVPYCATADSPSEAQPVTAPALPFGHSGTVTVTVTDCQLPADGGSTQSGPLLLQSNPRPAKAATRFRVCCNSLGNSHFPSACLWASRILSSQLATLCLRYFLFFFSSPLSERSLPPLSSSYFVIAPRPIGWR